MGPGFPRGRRWDEQRKDFFTRSLRATGRNTGECLIASQEALTALTELDPLRRKKDR